MDDVLLNKASIIERCLSRIREEYLGAEDQLETNDTRQDAIVLNLLRAAEATIDAAMHIVRVQRLGIPQQSRDAFLLLEENNLLDERLSQRMQAMVGFRNIAIHNYRKISLPILKSILENELTDFEAFSRKIIAMGG
ncbi:MAG TPA: DUF86 domain-containing protein [Gammaproteobacteria bacterium]|nr:DUF86 domain-containing protein [Gammaproteobacteria bacterium]